VAVQIENSPSQLTRPVSCALGCALRELQTFQYRHNLSLAAPQLMSFKHKTYDVFVVSADIKTMDFANVTA
tara:strand:- start:2895 stop:3107 length:213 start_codon:yes stop_codon:yes gene_type:complete